MIDSTEVSSLQGMVDPGENELSGTAIREFCEEAIEGDETGALSPQEKKKRRAEIVKRFVQHKQMEEPVSMNPHVQRTIITKILNQSTL